MRLRPSVPRALRRTLPAALVVSAALTLVPGCGGSDPVGPRDPEEVSFHASLGVDLDQMTRSETGLYYQTLEEGEGEEVAEEGDRVTVGYFGWLHTGQQFGGGELRDQTLGSAGLIDGFREGIEGMRLNETRLLVIPWELGYGSEGVGIIPPYAILVFDVTLESLVKASS